MLYALIRAPDWNVRDPDDVCGICQNYFDGVCGACRDPGDACPLGMSYSITISYNLAIGQCTHEFHLHCITKWLSEKHEPLCPLCKRPWGVYFFSCNKFVSNGFFCSSNRPYFRGTYCEESIDDTHER